MIVHIQHLWNAYPFNAYVHNLHYSSMNIMKSYEMWMIENWNLLKIGGLSLVIFMLIFLCIGPGILVPFPIYISGAFFIFVGVFIYHLGVSGEFFSKIITSFTDEIKIKWLTAIITIKDYHITYFSAVNPYSYWIILKHFVPREEIPSGLLLLLGSLVAHEAFGSNACDIDAPPSAGAGAASTLLLRCGRRGTLHMSP